MTTLRDRLIALAEELAGPTIDYSRSLAIAAARMALEEADRLCREKAQHDYKMAALVKAATDKSELMRRLAMGNRCDDCADDIRYLLRDQLP